MFIFGDSYGEVASVVIMFVLGLLGIAINSLIVLMLTGIGYLLEEKCDIFDKLKKIDDWMYENIEKSLGCEK